MILQALNGYYHRTAARDDSKIAPPGFSYQQISFAVILSPSGDVVDIQDLRNVDGKKARPVFLLVPQPPKRAGKSPPPAFMWDKTAYAFGVEADDSGSYVENTAYRDAFRSFHKTLLGDQGDAGSRAFLAFLEKWQPESFGDLRHSREMVDQSVVFRLENEREYLHQHAGVRAVWLKHQQASVGQSARCLVTGEVAPIARLHASIKGVDDAQSSGASIVSFNQESFASYGKDQGQNAPVSEAAAFAYTTALNELLSRESKQKVQIGDATTVFWAEADEAAAAQSAEFAAQFLFTPSQTYLDDSATSTLANEVMQRIEKGRPLENPELKLFSGTRFYILGLSPNAARLSVRFWHQTTLGELGAAFHEHWHDLHMETPPRRGLPPSVPALALRTGPARKDANDRVKFSFDDVSPRVAGELMRAILTRGRYPGSLLATLVMRIRSDGYLDHTRASLIKAILVRTMRLEGRLPKEDYLVRTDPDDPNTARRLGRLFAVLERTQTAALGDKINATIKDKYLGAAAATPGRVFPGLITNAAHHTARLRKGHSDAKWVKKPAAAGFALDRDIGRLTANFTEGFPAQQSIEEQGLFLVGYYQERFGGRPDPAIGDEAGVDIAPADEINDQDEEQGS